MRFSLRFLGLKRAGRQFSPLLVAEVTRDDVERWLIGLELSPTSRNNYRRVLVVLFNFARSLNLCATNPAEHVAVAKVGRPPQASRP